MAQRYKFESKSQLGICNKRVWLSCFLWLKGTNLKANHNTSALLPCSRQLFPMAQRYKFESKSQPVNRIPTPPRSCFLWLKGTNLKANHNCQSYNILRLLLFPMAQRYKFESKSQLNLLYLLRQTAVSYGSKVQIWKQIKADMERDARHLALFLWSKYKFEVKSQPYFVRLRIV